MPGSRTVSGNEEINNNICTVFLVPSFVWSCLADKPWLKVLLIGLVREKVGRFWPLYSSSCSFLLVPLLRVHFLAIVAPSSSMESFSLSREGSQEVGVSHIIFFCGLDLI